MILDGIDTKWRDAVEDIGREFSILQATPFEGSALQPPADLLVHTPNTLDPDISETLRWVCQKTARFLFLVLPYETDDQPKAWRALIEGQLGLREWYVFDHPEKRIICTARRTTEWQMGAVYGAMRPPERRAQILHNITTHKPRVKVPQPENNVPVIMVCYGPSIHETWRGAVNEAKYLGGVIVSNSGAHDFLIKKGVIPNYHVEIDPREERAQFSDEPHKDVEYLIASTCSPKLTEKLASYNMKLFHLNSGQESEVIYEHEPDAVMTDGGACVSLRAMSLLYQMGHRYFSIYGFDCSFKNDMQWAGKHPGKLHKVQEAKFPAIPDRVFKTSSALLTYATQFFEHVRMLPDAKFYLHGDGLLQNWARANAIEHAKLQENAA